MAGVQPVEIEPEAEGVAEWVPLSDPRMPTLAGFRRRGFTPEAIRDFCARIGIAKKENVIDVALLEHISPIEWDNVILYGQYVLDRAQVR